MSFAETQYLALALNVILGFMFAAFVGDMNPLLGPLAWYVLIIPAGGVHLICGLLEGEKSRREAARLGPTIDVEAERRRIANAGYPEQHRLFMEDRLQRGLAGRPPRSRDLDDRSEDGLRAERRVHAMERQIEKRALEAARYQASIAKIFRPNDTFDLVGVRAVAAQRFRRESGLPPGPVSPTVAMTTCDACQEEVPTALATCWYCSHRQPASRGPIRRRAPGP